MWRWLSLPSICPSNHLFQQHLSFFLSLKSCIHQKIHLQATLSVYPFLIHLSILYSVNWVVVAAAAEVRWQVRSRRPSIWQYTCVLSCRQDQTHLCASQHANILVEISCFLWPMCLLFSSCMPGVLLLAYKLSNKIYTDSEEREFTSVKWTTNRPEVNE